MRGETDYPAPHILLSVQFIYSQTLSLAQNIMWRGTIPCLGPALYK